MPAGELRLAGHHSDISAILWHHNGSQQGSADLLGRPGHSAVGCQGRQAPLISLLAMDGYKLAL